MLKMIYNYYMRKCVTMILLRNRMSCKGEITLFTVVNLYNVIN